MRYIVRDFEDQYGVWDTTHEHWQYNADDMVKTSEADAEVLAAGLNGLHQSRRPSPQYLCDADYERATGEIAVCQDGCNLSLDHAGLCDGPEEIMYCTRCGEHGRLTRVP